MTDLKYTDNRQTAHLATMGDVEINRRLEALASSFGQAWLETAGAHPLKNLWSRKDALATCELVLVGDAILSFNLTDPKWVSARVRDIKNRDPNTRRGAMFELLGLNLLRAPTTSVKPTSRNHPGYDAVVTLADGATLNVSLKSYGTSVHEERFLAESSNVEKDFVVELRALRVAGMTLRVMARTNPSASDWKVLRQTLPDILKQADYGRGRIHQVGEIWAVVIHDVPAEVLPLSLKYLSYQVLVLAPYHQNEFKNLTDKLDDAAANAQRHATSTSTDTARVVLVRLPDTISLEACGDWARAYIAENPGGPIDVIVLYQPTVIDAPNGTSNIDHGFLWCVAESYTAWRRPNRQIALHLAVGSSSGYPTRRQLVGGANTPNIDRMYSYQRGEFFTLFDQKPGTPAEGHVDNLASGIFRHAVFSMQHGEEVTLAGVFPEVKILSLFA